MKAVPMFNLKTVTPRTLAIGLALLSTQAHAFDTQIQFSSNPSPDASCQIVISQNGTSGVQNAFVSAAAPGVPVAAAGGQFFAVGGIIATGGVGAVSAGDLAACGWDNARMIVQEGADGTFPTDDRIGITFRAEDRVDGLTRDYEFALVGAAATSVVVTATLVVAPPGGGTATPADEMVTSFLNQRTNQLLSSQPNLTSLLNGTGLGNFDARFTGGRGQLNFSSSGSQPVWVRLNASYVDEDSRDSTYLFGAAGGHVALSPDFIIGGMIEFDYFDQEEGADGVDGTGWLVGPYFVSRLDGKNLYLEGKLLYGQSDNDITSGTTTGSFDSERYLAQFRLSGDMRNGKTRFIPSIAASYASDRQESYTDSTATLVASQRVELGQLRVGVNFETPVPFFNQDNAMLLTGGISAIGSYVGGDGDASGIVTDYEGGRARLDLGLVYQANGGGVLDVSTFYDGIGTGDYEAFGLSAAFNLNF